MSTQFAAQICINGHVITDSLENSPEFAARFCKDCGEKTISKCSHCGINIRGHVSYDGIFGAYEYKRPSFCHSCGKPYPWTELAIQSAIELAEMSGTLSSDDIEKFKSDIPALSTDSPKTALAVARTKQILAKVGKEVADGIRSIIVDVASETVKKMMGL